MKKASDEPLSIDEVLKKYWGYDEFRPMQREIIESVMGGKDTLALLPTGGGKSLTYQIPAIAMAGTAIVITPLIALMKDQVDRLRAIGIAATAIHSGLSMRQIDTALDNCAYGETKIIYIAPERLASQSFKSRLTTLNISLVAVDEAHCISQWGYDFRPSYLQIGELRELFVGAPILALTASATQQVCEDIMQSLKFKEQVLLKGDFSRPNLVYAVRHTTNKNELLLRMLTTVSGSAIVYTRTRKGCEIVTDFLRSSGFTATFYHGGLPHAERSIRQDEWLTGEVRVMVATNAFGMGIDKPDVRLVIHYVMCDCLEAYYQEAGRAGRDGKRSYAALIVSDKDAKRVERSIEMEFPSLETIKLIYNKIGATLQIGYGEGEGVSMPFDARQFCYNERIFSATFTKAIKLLQMNGYLSLTDELKLPSQVIFLVSRDELYKIRINYPDVDIIIRLMLRLYDGIFTDFRAIDEVTLARVSGYTLVRVKEILATLWRLRVIRYVPTNKTALLTFERARVPVEDVYISPQSYKIRKDLYSQRFIEMVRYVENSNVCRAQMMIQYFGIDDQTECGVCDICVERRKQQNPKVVKEGLEEEQNMILAHVKRQTYKVKELQQELKIEVTLFTQAIDDLLKREIILINAMGEITPS